MKGKLVRDKIPALTVANNQQVYVKILSKEEFQGALILELINKLGILKDGNEESNVEILAEAETIIRHLAEINKISPTAIETVYNKMVALKGNYSARLFMEIHDEKSSQ